VLGWGGGVGGFVLVFLGGLGVWGGFGLVVFGGGLPSPHGGVVEVQEE